jgi:hypothetical protein
MVRRIFPDDEGYLLQRLSGVGYDLSYRGILMQIIIRSSVVIMLALSFVISPLCLLSARAQVSRDGEPVAIGTYRHLRSEILGEDRPLLVCLPEDYEASSMAYPVLFVLYGGQVRGYFAEAVHAVSRLSDEGSIPPMIIVGVANIDRYRDLSPVGRRGNPSGIEPFSDFVEKELLPFVDKEYRTKDYRMIIGPQAGAAFGLYTLIKRPGLFDAFILENPFRSEPVHDLFIPIVEELLDEDQPTFKFIQITCADREGYLDKKTEVGYMREFQSMVEKNNPANLTLITHYLDNIPDFIPPLLIKEGLRELFREYNFPADREVRGLSDLTSYYAALSGKLGFNINIPEKILADEATELADRGESDRAIVVLEYLIELYPSSLNGYWRLANLYRELGNREAAIENYRKCLEIMPNMPPAMYWLEKLEAGD